MGDKTIWQRLTVDAVERVINKAVYIHNNECNGADSPIHHGPWSIQPGHHRRRDMERAILAIVREEREPDDG